MADVIIPAPGIVIVVPDNSEKVVGAVVIACTSSADSVATGKVVAVGPPRGEGDPDIQEVGLQAGMKLYYTKNGARGIGDEDQVAVDMSCLLAWE